MGRILLSVTTKRAFSGGYNVIPALQSSPVASCRFAGIEGLLSTLLPAFESLVVVVTSPSTCFVDPFLASAVATDPPVLVSGIEAFLASLVLVAGGTSPFLVGPLLVPLGGSAAMGSPFGTFPGCWFACSSCHGVLESTIWTASWGGAPGGALGSKSGSAMVWAGTNAIVVASLAASPSGFAVITNTLAPEAVASTMIASALLNHPGPELTINKSPVASMGVHMSPKKCTLGKPRWKRRIANPRMMSPSLPKPCSTMCFPRALMISFTIGMVGSCLLSSARLKTRWISANAVIAMNERDVWTI